MKRIWIALSLVSAVTLYGTGAVANETVHRYHTHALAADAMLWTVSADGCMQTQISVYGTDNRDLGAPGGPTPFTGAFVGYYIHNVCANEWIVGSYFSEPAPFRVEGGTRLDSASLDCSFDLQEYTGDVNFGLEPIANRPTHHATVHLVWKGIGHQDRYDASVGHIQDPSGTGYSWQFVGSYRLAEMEVAVELDGNPVDIKAPTVDAPAAYLYSIRAGETTVVHP